MQQWPGRASCPNAQGAILSPMPLQTTDPLLLQAALIGLRQMKADIDGKMSDIRQRLGVDPAAEEPTSKKAPRKKRKRKLSAAGRANIIAALKKRWAERRKEQERAKAKPPAKAAPKKAGVQVKRTPARKPAPRKTGKPEPAPVTPPEPTAPPAEA